MGTLRSERFTKDAAPLTTWQVDITDTADPAPYWLVSCRRPDAVVTAVRVGRTAGRSG